MIYQYGIVILLTVVMFGLPVLIFSKTKRALTPFSFNKLTRAFNFALIPQLALAIIVIATLAYLDQKIYPEGRGTDFTDLIMGTGMTYLIIGAYFYLPSLLIINLIKWIKK